MTDSYSTIAEVLMDFARIRRNAQPIALPEWSQIIASHACLEQIPDRTGINPFTNEKIVFPGAGKAYYVVDDNRVGNASLEDGEILTTGIPQGLCEEIAKRLKAAVFEDDRS